MTSRGELTCFDRILGCVWALLVGAVAYIPDNQIIVDSADSFLVAFGLRPPEHSFPLLWHNIISIFSTRFGVAETMRPLYWVGPIFLAILALISNRLFSLLLPWSMRTWANNRRWGRVISYTLPILGSAIFIFSPIVWPLGRVFSSELMMLFIFVTSVYFAVRAFVRISTTSFILTGVTAGILAAETPIAFLIPVFAAIYLCYRNWEEDEDSPSYLANPLLRFHLIKWMSIAFVIFWVGAISLNMAFFFAHGGVDSGSGVFFQLVRFFKHYLIVTTQAATPFGLMFLSLIIVAPVVFSIVRIRRATNITQFLPLRHSFFFLIFGVLSLLQASPFSSWWFWRWSSTSNTSLIASDFLLSVCMLGAAYVAFSSISVFIVDVYFRNTRFLARELLWGEDCAIPMIVKVQRFIMLSGRFFRVFLFWGIVVAVISIVVLGRYNPTEIKAKKIVEEYVRNVVRTSAPSPILITDGTLDEAIELAAAIEGRDLTTLSLMAGTSAYEIKLRKRIDRDKKYAKELSLGTAETLRTWVRDNASIISNLSIQVGFELWRENRMQMPKCGGYLAKTDEFSDFSIANGVCSARALAEDILLFREECDISKVESLRITSYLSRIQWRLSRMCRMRAYAAMLLRDGATVKRENELADRLDEANPEWVKVREIEDTRLKSNTLTLTPKEGLNLSLKRADFRLASTYAKGVLEEDENDVAANFALGMGYFMEHKYDLAEESLKRALTKAPNEPAILNNLAVVLIRLDRFDEAETNAVKALKILPDSSEIQETIRRINELKTEQK